MWNYKYTKCFIIFFQFQTNKILQTMHCVPSNTASCWCGLSASFRYLIAMSKALNSVATATVPFNSCNICVLRTLFFLEICCLIPLARTPTQDSPTKVLPQSSILLICLQPMVWKPEQCCKTLCQQPLHKPLNMYH